VKADIEQKFSHGSIRVVGSRYLLGSAKFSDNDEPKEGRTNLILHKIGVGSMSGNIYSSGFPSVLSYD